MTPVAERFVGGLAAPAKGNRGAAGKVEGHSLRIEDLEFAFDPDGAVV
jgi:hypothetical protein